MSTHLAVELEALPENCIITVEKNRWRTLWLVLSLSFTVATLGCLAGAIGYSTCEASRRYTCVDEQAAAWFWLVAAGGCLFWALVWFAIWWATRKYRPVLLME